MKKLLQENRTYFTLYVVFLTVGLLLLLGIPFGEEVLFFQQYRSTFNDYIFYGLTLVAQAPYVVVLIFLIAVWSYRLSFVLLGSYLINGLIFTRIPKRLFAHVRPAGYFESKGISVHSILEVVEKDRDGLPRLYGFPSGHTSTIFILITLLAFYLPKKWSIPLLFLGLIVAISRIYLSAHFLKDILFGSFIGVVGAVVLYFLYLRFDKRLKKIPQTGILHQIGNRKSKI